jgi:nitrite reductase (NO-forming)
MSSKFEITRRSVLAGVAFAGATAPLVAATLAKAEDEVVPVKATTGGIANLERVKVELVAPPFVHAHTQKAEVRRRSSSSP